MFTKNVRKDRMRAPVRKTIRKPKFWQEFLKWLAICVAASLLVSYFYLEKRREAAVNEADTMFETYKSSMLERIEEYYEADEASKKAEYESLKLGLHVFALATGEYGAVYIDGEKLLETPQGYFALFIKETEQDGTCEYYYLEDASYLSKLETYKGGKYDPVKCFLKSRKYELDADMVNTVGDFGFGPGIYGFSWESVYINEETHTFLPGVVNVSDDWYYSKPNRRSELIDCTPSDTKGYAYMDNTWGFHMNLQGYLAPEKNEQNADQYFYKHAAIGGDEWSSPWCFRTTRSDKGSLSVFTILPMTSRITILAAVLAGVVAALIVAVILYQKKKTVWEIFDYRKKTTEAMAHDLKTPLAAISGYAECLEESSEKSGEYAGRIRENVSEMNQMLEKILHFSNSEGARDAVKRTPVDLEKMIREVTAKEQALLERNRLTPKIVCEEGDGCVIETDEERMRQVVENLISNCRKYGEPDSEVEIRIAKERVSFRNRTDLRDVDVEELKKPFVKGDSARGENGTGLGLAIVESNLAILGYRLELELKDGCFTATVVLK